jgi:copper chaperone
MDEPMGERMSVMERTLELVALSVPGISCGHCERAITAALAPVAGVNRIEVDVPAKRVRVDYDPNAVGIATLTGLLAEADYPVAEVETVEAVAAPGGEASGGCSCCSPAG